MNSTVRILQASLISLVILSIWWLSHCSAHARVTCIDQTATTKEEVPADIAILIQRGDELLRAKHYVEAIEQYKAAIARAKPPVFTAYLNLGSAYYEKGDLQEALGAYRKSVEVRPNDYRGYYNLAEVLYSLGNYREAETQYRKVIALNPPRYMSAQTHHFLGLALYKQGPVEEAIAEYRLAIESLDGKYAEAHYNLGIALLEQKNYRGAEQEFRITMEQDKDFVDAHFNLAVTLEYQQRFRESAEELERYLSLTPNSIEMAKIRAKIQQLKQRSNKLFLN
jgi:tetratricopeptide (TPR) repeat protein